MTAIHLFDHAFIDQLYEDADGLVAGVDEAGRGPLAGPVVAAAVILDRGRPIEGLDDSKKLTEKKREELFGKIREKALAWAIAEASVEEIDSINILNATMLAMRRAIEALHVRPVISLIDGNRAPDLSCLSHTVVKGDTWVTAISAASILAKVARDRMMTELDRLYPQYGFAKHKGYPTKAHLNAISVEGVAEVHRKSYGPVKRYL
jgi:ribonuclease HII